MASGRIGKANLSAATNTTVYTTPASTFTVATVSFCNRGSTTANIRLAVAAAGTPAASEYIEYDVSLGPNGVLERTGIVAQATKVIVARSSATNVSCVVMGIETAVPAS